MNSWYRRRLASAWWRPPKWSVSIVCSLNTLTLARLSDDWELRYSHPVLVVETFVDPAQFCGSVYTAGGWIEVGRTDGWGHKPRD